MAAAGILYFEVVNLTIFQRVDSVKFEICTKFGSNICYSN